MDPKPVGLSPRSTVRGRPRTTSTRYDPCARCGRDMPRLAKRWPEGRLCNICYYGAIHARGTRPECLQDRTLLAPPTAAARPNSRTCSDIPPDLHPDPPATEPCPRPRRRYAPAVLRGTPNDP